MPFSTFKNIADVQKAYQIRYAESSFISAGKVMVPSVLTEEFEFNKEHIDIFSSKAARSELITSPLLRAVYKNHSKKYSFWIQKPIAFDKMLSGIPDYTPLWEKLFLKHRLS